MLIRSIMTSPVFTIEAGMCCREAWKFFQDRGLRRVPVVRGKRVLGMLTDRDLKQVLPWTIEERERRDQAGVKVSVQSLLAEKMHYVTPNDHLERAAQIMLHAKIGGLPVIDGGELKGIVTESDIFKLFTRRTMSQHGHRLVLRGPKGPIYKLDPAHIAVAVKATIFDLAIYPGEKGRASIVMQVRTSDIQKLVDKFLSNGYELTLVEDN